MIGQYDFQKDAADDVVQKDASWRLSYTPPHNEVRVTRDTNDGATVISSFNFAAATALADADIVYPGIDTESADVFYEMRGRLKFTQSAQNVTGSSIAELMLRFTIAWGDSSTEYYVNTVADNSGLLTGWASSNGNYDGVPVIAVNPDYSAQAQDIFTLRRLKTAAYMTSRKTLNGLSILCLLCLHHRLQKRV